MREIPERSEESVTTEERREAGERREAQERREAEAQRLVRKVTESTVSVLLECGHRNTVHVASSGFDFPGDEQHCDECGTGRLMHPDLVARLVEAQAPPPEFPDLTDDAPRTEPCALCGEPTSHNYALQAEPTGGLGFVECWVFLCPRHAEGGPRPSLPVDVGNKFVATCRYCAERIVRTPEGWTNPEQVGGEYCRFEHGTNGGKHAVPW